MSDKNATGEKTEAPTPKRKKEARKEGQVPRTPEFGGWAPILVIALLAPVLVPRELSRLTELTVTSLRRSTEVSPQEALYLVGEGLQHAAIVLVVLGGIVLLVAVAAALSQGGFYVAHKAAKPSWKKLSLISGAKRVFGPHAAWEGVKVVIKSGVLALCVWWVARDSMDSVGQLRTMTDMLASIGDMAVRMLRVVAIAALVLAAADYAVQRRRIMKQIKMSKHDVKQEHKQAEGDPMLKSARRSRQLSISRNRMMASVADADVVLVNPTHVAVALKYEQDAGAPTVVARGAGAIATAIRERAADNDVPLVRDVPLARALYRSTEVGMEIPAELFVAVAQVLAFVISRRQRGATGGQHDTPRPHGTLTDLPDVPDAARRRRRTAGAPPRPRAAATIPPQRDGSGAVGRHRAPSPGSSRGRHRA